MEKPRPFLKSGVKIERHASIQPLSLAPTLIGQSVADYQSIADKLQEQAPLYPAARCGLETAMLDAHARSHAPRSGNSGDRPMSGIGNRHHHSHLRSGQDHGTRS